MNNALDLTVFLGRDIILSHPLLPKTIPVKHSISSEVSGTMMSMILRGTSPASMASTVDQAEAARSS